MVRPVVTEPDAVQDVAPGTAAPASVPPSAEQTSPAAAAPERRPGGTGAWVLLPAVAVLVVIVQLLLLPALAQAPWAAAVVPVAAFTVLLAVAALCRFEWFIAGLLVVRPLLDVLKTDGPALVQPTTLLSLLLLLVAPVWLVAQRRATGRLPLTALVLVTGAFVVSMGLSAIGAADVADAGSHVVRAASWFVMFLVVRRLADDRRTLAVVIGAVAASTLLPALAGYLELATPGNGLFMELKDGMERLRATFDQSNNYARYLMLVMLAALPAFALLRRRWQLVLAAALLVLTPLLLFTYARTAWIGLAAGAVAMLWVGRHRLVVAVLAVLGAGLLAVPGVLDRMGRMARPATGVPESQNDSLLWRLEYWRDIVGLSFRNPLTGIGPDGTVSATVHAKEPHNEYLRAVIEGGVLGLIVYLALLVVATVVAARVARRARTPFQRAVGLAGVGVVVAVAVAGIASNIVLSVSFMWYFAVVLSVVDHAARVQTRLPATPEEN